jgi:hypothetical protein
MEIYRVVDNAMGYIEGGRRRTKPRQGITVLEN